MSRLILDTSSNKFFIKKKKKKEEEEEEEKEFFRNMLGLHYKWCIDLCV